MEAAVYQDGWYHGCALVYSSRNTVICIPGFLLFRNTNKKEAAMEFLSGVKEKETWELSALLAEDAAGRMVKTNGAVHAVRDMGSVAFVMLRKREGLLQ